MGSEAEVGRIMGWPIQVAMIVDVWEYREGREAQRCRVLDGGLCAHCWREWVGQAQSQDFGIDECSERWNYSAEEAARCSSLLV